MAPPRDPLAGSPFEAVIGLEVHVQLATSTKMFCRCPNLFGAPPNSLVCPVCLGYPGSLPYINRQAVDFSLRVATACHCRIEPFTKFDRKNYYYPDQPKNYQISQFDEPIGQGGYVEFLLDGEKSRVQLKRIHMEEDAGKNVHAEGRDVSWVDLNRAGVPLLEIVTDPDLHTPAQAGAYLRTLRLTMLYLGVSDCNMEEGSLRCDVNASIRPRGSKELETRTEIKNLNSFTNIENALEFELERQVKRRTRGEEIIQQTLLFDPNQGVTKPMRGKEEAHDYRYFPEPDLAPLTFTAERLAAVEADLPELPLARHERFVGELGLSDYHADLLVRDPDAALFFDRCVEIYAQPKSVANWVTNALKEEMNARKATPDEIGISPERFVDLVKAVDDGVVSTQKARDVFKAMLESDDDVAAIVEKLGLEQISDDSVLREQVEKVVAQHPGPAEELKSGKDKALNFLVGQVMRETKGKANPGIVSKLIREVVGG